MLPGGVAIYVATTPVDLRGGFDRLAGYVAERLRGDPRGTSLYVFVNKRRTRVKVLFFDRTGHCILYKRLDRGTFRLPTVIEPGSASVGISSEELALLLQGIDLPGEATRARSARKNPTRKIH
jgi:transposase